MTFEKSDRYTSRNSQSFSKSFLPLGCLWGKTAIPFSFEGTT